MKEGSKKIAAFMLAATLALSFTGYGRAKSVMAENSQQTNPRADITTMSANEIHSAGGAEYSYDNVTDMFTDAQFNALAKVVAKVSDGEIGSIYKLSDDLYYVITYMDNKPCGGAVVKHTAKHTDWRVVSSGAELMTEAQLREAINADRSKSNIKLDHDKTENGEKQLRDALNNIDGSEPNDAAKTELASYIESCISADSRTTVKSDKNHIEITGKTIEKSVQKAVSSYDKLMTVLDENDIMLNRVVINIADIVCCNVNMDETVQITLDSSIAAALGEADGIRLIMGDTVYSIRVMSNSLEQFAEQYGSLAISLQKTGGSTYLINFADEHGNIKGKLVSGLTFTVPASDALCTVRAEYMGGTDNWGGQYDEKNKTIFFNTSYSGTYTVIEDSTSITDIDGLAEDEQKAIHFMVSKGYFSTKNNMFYPNRTLTRYDFSQALVRMFFALDRFSTCEFKDVTEDDPYYPYVASGVAIHVIEGYDDGEFKGDQDTTREEMLALCSRTLREKKGYIEPENPEDYLEFTDTKDIQDWARSEIALDVREELIAGDGKLNPAGKITRAESAKILYKLFMLLNEVEQEPEINTKPKTAGSQTTSPPKNMMPVIIVGSVSISVLLAAAILIVLRKRNDTRHRNKYR
ncbi:MAG: S-layer homology domain-containing protein [Oscillospiraceae bacterium]|nr:S-layer homology domain-containing protein [Oscillospiraceae bacterium]